jgi:MarR family transcriptional regulator, transcriptional regulator for hemolysin
MDSPDTPRFPHALKRLYLLMSQAIDEALRSHGLARAQWQALSYVYEAGTLSQRALQERMKIESATLAVIVDLLVSKGWLERQPDPTDKRVRLLRFAPGSRARWLAVPDPVAAVEAKMLDGLSEAEAARARRLVARMVANLEDERRV